MNEYIAGYEYYDQERIRSLCNDPCVKGVLLGDLFCQKRMFENGIADLFLLMNDVLLSSKEVFYQLPLYVTSRNMDEVKAVLNLMERYDKDSYAIVQDFGTAEWIARDFSRIKLIWGQLGRVRELRYSDDFLHFLKKKSFTGMETFDRKLSGRLASLGLVPFFSNCKLEYQTLGRQCYLEYQTGLCNPAVCRKGSCSLKTEDEDFQMTIDGFVMGKKYRMTPEEDMTAAIREFSAQIICRY